MPTVDDLLERCPYLEYVNTQNFQGIKDAMFFQCTALQEGMYLTREAGPQTVNAGCLGFCGVPEGVTHGDEPPDDPWFLEKLHSSRRDLIRRGYKWPQFFERPDFMIALVEDVKRIGGRGQARQAVIAAIRNGLDVTEGQKLIDDVIEKVEVL